MEDKLKELLQQEENYREKKNNQKWISTFREIIELIKDYEDENKYNILSKLFLQENQPNFTKMLIFNDLLKNTSFINDKNTKKKYYLLLIDSFNSNKIGDHSEQTTKIKELFKKNDLNDFEEIDMYLELFIVENENKKEVDNFNEDSTDREFFEKTENKKDNLNVKISGNNYLLDSNINPINSPLSPLSSKTNLDSETLQKMNFDEFKNNIIEDINNNMSDSGINNKDKNIFKKYKPNNSLPMIIISVSVNMNPYQFLILINQTFNKFNYNNISTLRENEYENLRIYQYVPKNCFDYISEIINTKGKCIRNQFHVYSSLKRDENNFSSGLSQILKDSYVSIKSVKGIESNIIKFMIQFLKTLCQSVEKIKILKQSGCFYKYNLENELNDIIVKEKESKIIIKNKLFNFKNKKLRYKKLKNDDESMLNLNSINKSLNPPNITTTDSFKFLEIFTILSKSEYGLGKKISEFIEEFKKKYNMPLKNVEIIETREIMMKIIKTFEFCTNNLNTSFNNKNSKYNANYISLATEQYIFNKIYFILFNIYCEKYKENNKIIVKIQKEINDNLSSIEICNKLQVQSIYLGNEQEPFKSVVNIINQITFEKFLHKKFEILTQASLEIRKCILEYTDGKFELESMDDELPIIIFISTQVKVDNLIAELNMIDDYIKCSMRDNLVQNKMVTNLLSSLMYLSKAWNSKTLTFD